MTASELIALYNSHTAKITEVSSNIDRFVTDIFSYFGAIDSVISSGSYITDIDVSNIDIPDMNVNIKVDENINNIASEIKSLINKIGQNSKNISDINVSDLIKELNSLTNLIGQLDIDMSIPDINITPYNPADIPTDVNIFDINEPPEPEFTLKEPNTETLTYRDLMEYVSNLNSWYQDSITKIVTFLNNMPLIVEDIHLEINVRQFSELSTNEIEKLINNIKKGFEQFNSLNGSIIDTQLLDMDLPEDVKARIRSDYKTGRFKDTAQIESYIKQITALNNYSNAGWDIPPYRAMRDLYSVDTEYIANEEKLNMNVVKESYNEISQNIITNILNYYKFTRLEFDIYIFNILTVIRYFEAVYSVEKLLYSIMLQTFEINLKTLLTNLEGMRLELENMFTNIRELNLILEGKQIEVEAEIARVNALKTKTAYTLLQVEKIRTEVDKYSAIINAEAQKIALANLHINLIASEINLEELRTRYMITNNKNTILPALAEIDKTNFNASRYKVATGSIRNAVDDLERWISMMLRYIDSLGIDNSEIITKIHNIGAEVANLRNRIDTDQYRLTIDRDTIETDYEHKLNEIRTNLDLRSKEIIALVSDSARKLGATVSNLGSYSSLYGNYLQQMANGVIDSARVVASVSTRISETKESF